MQNSEYTISTSGVVNYKMLKSNISKCNKSVLIRIKYNDWLVQLISLGAAYKFQ